jgi:hypothetical protein
MISTAIQLLEISKESMFNPSTLILFKELVENKDNYSTAEFTKRLYDFTAHVISYNSAAMVDYLMSDEEMSDFNDTLAELDEMGEIFNGK